MQLIVCTALGLSCLFVYSFVYLFIYTAWKFFLSVSFYVHLFITTLTCSYFSACPSHSARLAFAISEWLYSPSFTIISFYFLLLNDSTLLYQEHNIVVVWLLLRSSLKYTDSLMKIFRLTPYNRWDKNGKRKVPCTVSARFT